MSGGIIAGMDDSEITWYCAECLTTFQQPSDVCPNLGCAQDRPSSGWGQMYRAGDVIDRTYRVSRRLALGGAGVTYLVRALGNDGQEHGPWIALKLLFASRDHGAYLRRLSTEAQILQELHHPNIVEYLGFVHRTGQSPYLLTQFEEGGSLLDHMKRVGTMGVREAAGVGLQVCLALEKGHAQGIIHRDIKPENLLLRGLTPKGDVPEIRVADFGIAKVSGSIGAGLTRAGAFVGTPQYAAPEQFVGHPASDKADVYSLGAVMVFMMTARPLVPKAHTLAAEDVYTSLMEVIPPTISRQSDTPEDCAAINQILASVMSLEPESRWTVSQLRISLGEFLDSGEAAQTQTEFEVKSPFSSDKALFTSAKADVIGHLTPTLRDPATVQGALDSAATYVHTDIPPAVIKESAPSVPKESQRMGSMRRLLVVAGVLSALVISAVSMHWVAEKSYPWLLDGLPVVGTISVDAVTAPQLGARARSAAKLASRRGRANFRRDCPESKGQTIDVEVVVGRDGSIRWARALDSSLAGSACVARRFWGVGSGNKLKQATKVRLQIQP